MSEISFIYKNRYYEYSKEELYPDVYMEDIDIDLKKLLKQRKQEIKELESNISLKNKKVEEKDISFFETQIKYYFSTIQEIEDTISKYIKDKNIEEDWYHPSLGKKITQANILEEQRKLICQNCGEILDIDYNFEDFNFSMDEYIARNCPICKSENSLLNNNVYEYQASQLEQETRILIGKGDFEASVKKRKEAIELLEKVNEKHENDFYSSKFEKTLMQQNIARTYISLKNYEAALVYINSAIIDWCELEECTVIGDYDCVAMGYACRMFLNDKLKKCTVADIINDLNLAIKYASYYIQQREIMLKEHLLDMNEIKMKECFAQNQSFVMETHLIALQALYDLDKSRVTNVLQDARNYLQRSNEIELDDRIRYTKYLNSIDDSVTADVSINSYSRKKEGCYIATAVYGDYDAPEVVVLRKFRDTVLNRNIFGRGFVKLYYYISPNLAERLKKRKVINQKVKEILDAVVKYLLAKNVSNDN